MCMDQNKDFDLRDFMHLIPQIKVMEGDLLESQL